MKMNIFPPEMMLVSEILEFRFVCVAVLSHPKVVIEDHENSW